MFVADWRLETPQQVQFVEKLSDVVISQLPNFWKLWISYVNGSLFSEVSTPRSIYSDEENTQRDTTYRTAAFRTPLVWYLEERVALYFEIHDKN